MVSDRSAAGSTVVVALAELLAGAGSAVVADTLAWLVIVPSGCGRDRDRDGRARWPLASVPSVQVTVPLDWEQLPCEGVAESNVTPAGRCR